MKRQKKSYKRRSKMAKSAKNGISKKIRILKKEGYKTKQAVAIAIKKQNKKEN